MLNNFSIEKARLLQQKQDDIKERLCQEFITHNSDNVSVTLSLLGRILEISNVQNKNLEDIIPIINEATAKAKELFEVKQAEMLQKEFINLM